MAPRRYEIYADRDPPEHWTATSRPSSGLCPACPIPTAREGAAAMPQVRSQIKSCTSIAGPKPFCSAKHADRQSRLTAMEAVHLYLEVLAATLATRTGCEELLLAPGSPVCAVDQQLQLFGGVPASVCASVASLFLTVPMPCQRKLPSSVLAAEKRLIRIVRHQTSSGHRRVYRSKHCMFHTSLTQPWPMSGGMIPE